MKVAILAESAADGLAIREIVGAIVGVRPEIVESGLESNGWASVRRNLPVIIRKLHYQSDAEGLVVLCDTDNTSLIKGTPGNRREELRVIVETTLRALSHVHGRPQLRVAIAVAAPAIEGWLLCPNSDDVGEASWEKGIIEQREPYSKRDLKRRLHGVERPEAVAKREKMIAAALECSRHVPKLRERFPNGFGGLYDDLLTWRSFR